MNKRYFLLLIIAISSALNVAFLKHAFSQESPQKINYQAVARDSDGEELGGATLDVEFNIYGDVQGSTLIYSEIHTDVITDPFGLFTLQIGSGISMQGSFNEIDWREGTFLGVGIDAGNGMTELGVFELVSVPYALYSSKSDSASYADYGADEDANPTNELQQLIVLENVLTLSGDTSNTTVDLSSVNTDSQQLGIGSSDLDSVEITLAASNPVSFSIQDADADSINELQSLVLTGSVLSLSNDDTGSEVDLGAYNTDNQALSIDSADPQNVEIGLDNSASINFSIEDGDADDSNELQELNLDAGILTLSDDASGTQVDLTAINTDSQTLGINSTNPQSVVISLDNSTPINFSIEDDDASLSNEVITNLGYNPVNKNLTVTEAGVGTSVDLSDLKVDENWTTNGSDITNTNTGNVGINESNPTSTLQIMGSTAVKVRVEGASPGGTTYLLGDEVVFIGTPDVGDVEVDLPPAAEVPGRIYIIKKGDPSTFNDLKIHPDGSDKIEGASMYILGNVSGVYEQIMIVSDGNDSWWIISKE